MIILKVCCKERVIELMKSIRDLWYEPYKDENYEYCISFGSENGIVIYWYEGFLSDIQDILKEVE